ncbi:YncE family protein [Algoriphagus sp. Y33]|uniref:YncE family protein n=1 Tax=Algoriphagus sp. Y33 TaxID=2772483 RepID=UPI001CE12505|nr:YncE family protein [Algoriphagus sp. Y33]
MTILTLMLGMLALYSFAQSPYTHDRVYTADQISNTVSVIDPSQNKLLGQITLGNPITDVLSPLYKGETLVHGLRYSPDLKILAVVAIGSNSISFISTETSKLLKTLYIGRSPHEPTFTPDHKQVWVTVRGEAYISVIDVQSMSEIKQIPVADGPGMVAFSPDGTRAYVCSSFTSEVDVINTKTYQLIKKIPVISPFSPNIFTSPDGKWVALTHKDVGKVSIINTENLTTSKVISTGAITNHVTFTTVNGRLKMLVSIGGENKVLAFDVADNFNLTDSINVGALPHGLWPSTDGNFLYVGLEFADQVQVINLHTMKVVATIPVGQSPQALVYAQNAVSETGKSGNEWSLKDMNSTQVITLRTTGLLQNASGRISVRQIGLTDLVEQAFYALEPNSDYLLVLSKATSPPYAVDYQLNEFRTDSNGKYSGQSTGLIKSGDSEETQPYQHILILDAKTRNPVLIDNLQTSLLDDVL